MKQPARSGHRLVPHTADLTLECWAASRAGCLEESVRALVGAFAETAAVSPVDRVDVHFERAEAIELLAAALEEVIFLLDTAGVVPVGVELVDDPGGGVTGTFDVVPVSALTAIGSPPKAVARSGLMLATRAGLWRGRATIDV